MSNLVLVVVVSLVVVNAIALFVFAKRFSGKKSETDGEGMKLLLTQLNEFSRTVDQKMAETNKMMNESVRAQFGESAKLIREVTTGLTKLDETNRQVVSFADQLQSLQDILKNPKQRGVLGEYYLETLLKNVLPPGSYQMQYAFKDGTIVDAAVFVKDKIIPVDSKFSLENYNRIIEEKNEVEKEKLEKAFVADLKNRITETAKYIQPSQGTMDFAFMFIPHEAIYYDLIINKIGALKEDSETLIQRAASKYHVLIVSPTSFLAYLQTVLQGLNALHIEEKAVEIIKRVEELGKHLKSYEEYYTKLGNALSTTINHYNSGYKELGKVDKDVLRITGSGIDLEPLTLDKPSVE
ncbi:MAG: DNA recombination protein RmuC [Patescibacteria group bacterium]